MIQDYQALQQRDLQKESSTTGKHRGLKLLATLDYVTGRIVWQEDEPYTAKTFLAFLRKVVEAYPTGKIALIVDNACIHHAKLLKPFLNEMKGRLKLVFLPPAKGVYYHDDTDQIIIFKKVDLHSINFISYSNISLLVPHI